MDSLPSRPSPQPTTQRDQSAHSTTRQKMQESMLLEILSSPGTAHLSSSDNIIDARDDESEETLLNPDEYDERHAVGSMATSERLWNNYIKLFTQINPNFQDSNILELAAGTGALTLAIAKRENSNLTVVSDVSPRMMKILEKKLVHEGLRDACSLILFDANKIPFIQDAFDIVVGNSVLHHLERFENTLHEVHRVLKAGGVAAFGEPILDTHVFVSQIADIIVQMEEYCHSDKSRLSPNQLAILNILARKSRQKAVNLKSNRTELSTIEDKFQFPIGYMSKLACSIGFRSFQCIPPASQQPTSDDLIRQIHKQFAVVFNQCGEDIHCLDEYCWVFESFRNIYFTTMKDFIMPPFSFFVFMK